MLRLESWRSERLTDQRQSPNEYASSPRLLPDFGPVKDVQEAPSALGLEGD